MPKKKTQSEFIEQARVVHGDRYDYSLVEYINSNTKVIVICSEHGEFAIAPDHHLNRGGCRKCYFDRKKYSQAAIIKKFKAAHGDRYDYSKVVYKGSDQKVTIICSKHGEFQQAAHVHYGGSGCRKCANENQFVANKRAINARKIDLTGRKFGRLTVIEESRDRMRNSLTWKCLCECGNTYLAISRDLLYRNKHHCGCVETFKQICREKDVDYWRALKRREAGMPEEKIFDESYIGSLIDTTPITVYGVKYPNLQNAVNCLKPVASKKTIQRCLDKGLTPEKAFEYIPNPGYANGIIYLLTNKINEKQYVGLTIQTLELRWKNHVENAQMNCIKSEYSLHAAIREYGRSAFTIEEIDRGTTKKDLEQKERYWIREKKTLIPNGYNISPGGTSGGSCKKPTKIDNIQFDSVNSAAEYLAERENITLSAAKRRISVNRINCQKPGKQHKRNLQG